MKEVRRNGDASAGGGGPSATSAGPGKQTLVEQIAYAPTTLGGDGAQTTAPATGATGDVESPLGGPSAVPNGPGKPTITLSMPESAAPPLTFSGATYRDLYKAVSARVGKEAGSVETALSTDIKGPEDHVTSVAFTAPLKTMLPEWTEKSTQPAPDQAKFDAWRGSVASHEAQHRAIYKTEYAKLKTQVIGPKESDIAPQATVVTDAAETAQDTFDVANQPAPLAIPGGIEKVQSTDASDVLPPSDTAPA